MGLPEIVDLARNFAVMVRVQGPDPKGLKMRKHAFHHYHSGKTVLSASGMLLPDSLRNYSVANNHIGGGDNVTLVVTVASVLEPFLSKQSRENVSQVLPELIPSVQIDIMVEGKMSLENELEESNKQAPSWLPAKLLTLVDVPVSSLALQTLIDASMGSPEHGWEIGWSLASYNAPQTLVEIIQTQTPVLHSPVFSIARRQRSASILHSLSCESATLRAALSRSNSAVSISTEAQPNNDPALRSSSLSRSNNSSRSTIDRFFILRNSSPADFLQVISSMDESPIHSDMREESPIEMESQDHSLNEMDESPIHSEFDESEAEPAKKRKRSKVWDHFIEYKTGDPLRPTRVKCRYCVKNYAYHSAKIGTSTCKTHLEKCANYPYRLPDKNQTVLSFDSSSSSLTAVGFSKDECRKACVRMVIMDELPFSHVEGEGFRYFCSVACPRFIPPSRRTLVRDVLALYYDEKKQLKKELSARRICLTTDTWTSAQQINYMVLTAHFIDDNWVLHKRILNFCVIANHKGNTIGKLVEQCLIEWGIDKVLTVTVDNASSNDKALEYIQKQLKSWGNCVEDGRHLHMRCGAHILNLIVGDGLKELHTSIQKIRNSVRYVRSSPARFQMFKTCVAKEKISSKGLVVMDVPTRWNSTYLMLVAAVKFHKAFARLEDDDEVNYKHYFRDSERVGPPKDVDWDIAHVFIEFLRSFYEVTLRFSCSLSPTSHLAFNDLFDIYGLLHDASVSPLLTDIATSMKLKYDKYWGCLKDDMNPLLFIAFILDPRYKLMKLRLFLKELYHNEFGDFDMVDMKIREIKEMFMRLYVYYGASFSTSSTTSASSFDRRSHETYGDDCSESSSKSALNETRRRVEQIWEEQVKENEIGVVSNEVDRYFMDALEKRVESFDILSWWKDVGVVKYKVLGAIAKDVLAIPISTVASESSFSTGGRVIDPFRCSLTPKMVEALICTQNWLRSSSITLHHVPTAEEMEFYEEIESEMLSASINMPPPCPPKPK